MELLEYLRNIIMLKRNFYERNGLKERALAYSDILKEIAALEEQNDKTLDGSGKLLQRS